MSQNHCSKIALLGGNPTLNVPAPHFKWPLLTGKTRAVAVEQLDTTLSIYDRSGIFETFETAFAGYHGLKYGLVTSSGTAALFAAFEATGIKPGDRVIVPSYTFFATASPLMYLGAEPVFCDCDSNGNLDPLELSKLLDTGAKAVVITHMWGVPCQAKAIADICKERRVILIEDCSHAHGARINGQLVGTFGDVAAWSLQGQKIITGGEGGILLTNDPEIYYRSLLQGQYNKRCRQEIPKDHPLARFAITGFGLKLRAHPVAIAIANEQFGHLDAWLLQKRAYAAIFNEALGAFSFIDPPDTRNAEPSWYAYVFRYSREKAGSAAPSIDQFFGALLAEGLADADRPGSTRPLNDFPLFTDPHIARPGHYKASLDHADTPKSEQFYSEAIKIPVWARSEDEWLVRAYADGIAKVCSAIAEGSFTANSQTADN